MIATEERTVTQLWVQMAHNEWSSTHPMHLIAQEQFALHPEVQNLVVYVQEHAGWYLAYGMLDGKMVIVDTANDAATITGERRRFWERVRGSKWHTLPTVRRE